MDIETDKRLFEICKMKIRNNVNLEKTKTNKTQWYKITNFS